MHDISEEQIASTLLLKRAFIRLFRRTWQVYHQKAEGMSKSTGKPYTLYDLGKPLSSVYIRRAAKELGENPKQISAHLESFRRWLNSMPHLKINVGMFIFILSNKNYI